VALNIKSRKAERDVRQLATGESLTESIHKAVRERLERVGRQSRRMDETRWARVEAIGARAQAISITPSFAGRPKRPGIFWLFDARVAC
jgi:antitoxin VapB